MNLTNDELRVIKLLSIAEELRDLKRYYSEIDPAYAKQFEPEEYDRRADELHAANVRAKVARDARKN